MAFAIETPRLLIRPWRPDDRAVFASFAGDSRMMLYIGDGSTWSEARIEAFFARQARYLDAGGFCIGAVVLRESRQVVGVGGLQPQGRCGDIELAWWIGPPWQRRGLATEVGKAALDYGLDALACSRVVAIADPENAASIRVMQKIGMRYLDTVSANTLEARYPDMPVVRYAATRGG